MFLALSPIRLSAMPINRYASATERVPGAAFICTASLRVNDRNTSSDGFVAFGHFQHPEIGGSWLSPGQGCA